MTGPRKQTSQSIPLEYRTTSHGMTIRFNYDTATEMLWSAVHFEEQNAQLAKNALDAGADVNAREEDGTTPLISASFGDSGSLIRLLLERGAGVNASDCRGSTALMNAASFNAGKVTSILIKHGAEIEARDDGGRTALHVAANCADWIPRACSRLIKCGANIEVRDIDGRTPLMHAVQWGRYSAVRLLLKRGADANAKSNNGYSVLRWHQEPLPAAGCEGETNPGWPIETDQEREERLPTDNIDRFWVAVFRLREIVFGIPVDDYLALEKLLILAGAKEYVVFPFQRSVHTGDAL